MMTEINHIEIFDHPSFYKIIRITTKIISITPMVETKIKCCNYVLLKKDSLIVNQLLTTKSNKLALLNIKNNSTVISIVAKSILDPINYQITVQGQWNNYNYIGTMEAVSHD